MDINWNNGTINADAEEMSETLSGGWTKSNDLTSLNSMEPGTRSTRTEFEDTYETSNSRHSTMHQSIDLRNAGDWRRSYSTSSFSDNSNNSGQMPSGERYKILRITNGSSKSNNPIYANSDEGTEPPTGDFDRKWLIASTSQTHGTTHSGGRSSQHSGGDASFSDSNSPKYSIRSRGTSSSRSENESNNTEFKVVLKREARNLSSPVVYKKLKWQCSFCGECQATRLSLVTHIKSHLQPYCKLCLKVVASKEQLHHHMESKHHASAGEDEDQPDTQFVTSKYGRRRRVFSTSALLPKRKYDLKKSRRMSGDDQHCWNM